MPSPTAETLACSLIERINDAILYPLILLLLSVALLLFLWGVFQYIANAEGDEARATGKKHMLFGVIGLVIMVSALTILEIAAATVGASIPGC